MILDLLVFYYVFQLFGASVTEWLERVEGLRFESWLISSWMTYSAICRKSEKKVSFYKLHMTPLYNMNKVSTIGLQMELKP